MTTIYTEIMINAPISQVWNTLTHFSDYSTWNPFIVEVKGEAKLSQSLKIKILSKDKVQVFTPDVVNIQSPVNLEWVGKLPAGAFKGHHCFDLESVSENQTKLVHQEHFSGWLKPLIMLMISKDTKKGFNAMNLALKKQVENSQPQT